MDDASDNHSDGECEFDVSDHDFRYEKRETKVLLKKEPELWVARNPGRLLGVMYLKLELPDNVSNISNAIRDLRNLKALIIKRGINLNSLPHTLPTLLNLARLQLENCPNLSQLPSNFGIKFLALRFLIIQNCGIKFLPQSLSLIQLTLLELNNCVNLSQLPSNFGNLVALRNFKIQNCGIKFLPQSLSLIQLEVLELNNCLFIQELPPGLDVHSLKLVGCHVKSFSAKPRYLRTLEINNCLYVNDILTTLNHFHSLDTLVIKGCDMESLPNSITGIHNLERLDIEDCINLKWLPQNLSQLAYLTLINCGLESIPTGLRSLRSLSIENCPMEFLFIKEFVSLIYFTIKSCNIKSLDGCITRLTKLKRLSIQDCVVLEDLPTDINTLISLETLCIEGCTRIKFLPSLAALNSLSDLSLKGCSRLDELPADIEGCTRIKSLDGCITGLTKLQDLTIKDCVVLEDLPTDINTLVSLQELCIEGCTSIKFLPSLAALHNLELLSLVGCSRLDELPADFDKLTNLKSLQLMDTNVQSLPSTIIKLPNLEDIHLPGCFRLETLTNNFDLEGVDIYLPLSFRLDILPAKFSVTRDCTAYQLHFIDQKESRLELINDKECDDTDECDGYWQTMVNTPPNLTHLPQPRPGICTNLDGEACPEGSRQAITHNHNPLNGHLNLALTLQLDAFHIPDEQVPAGTSGYLDEGRSSFRNAFINLDVGRNRTGFAHDGDGPSKQIEASEYLHGKDEHIMNYSRVMSQRESRDSESVDSTSHSVTSKALSKEATSLLRTKKRTMGRAIDDGHRMKQRKSQLGTRDGRCESMLSSTQDKMYKVLAKHKENEIDFKFKPESSFAELKQELAERLPLEGGKLKIKYLDASENLGKGDPNASIVRDWVLMTCDADLRHCERYSLGMEISLLVQENQDGRS